MSQNMNKTTVAKTRANKKSLNKHKHKKSRRKRFSITGENTFTQDSQTSVYDYLKNNLNFTKNDSYAINKHWLSRNYTPVTSYQLTSTQPYDPIVSKVYDYDLADVREQTKSLVDLGKMSNESYRKIRSVYKNSAYNMTESFQNAVTEYDFGETAQIAMELDRLKMKAFQMTTDDYSYPKFGFSRISFVEGIPISIGTVSLQPPFVPGPPKPIRNSYCKSQTIRNPSVTKLKRVIVTAKTQNVGNLKPFSYWSHKLNGRDFNRTKNMKRQKKRRHNFIEYNTIDDVNTNNLKDQNKLSMSNENDRYNLFTKQPFTYPTDNDGKFEKMATEANVRLFKIKHKRNASTYLNFVNRESQLNSNNSQSFAFDDYENEKNEPANKIEYTTTPSDTKYTIFEDLVEKLHYKDYVNGYKHYLKFQKEQGHQNYSNLVRYQAHRHHNVDDIGKFILNKLPQVPAERQRRAFYDESETTEDQDISTKNEESWFKKHFYVFIDSGQPKMYHTSQTVSLRPPSVDPDFTEKNVRTKPTSTITKPTTEIDLDNLSKSLGKYKSFATCSTTLSTIDNYEENVNDDDSFEAMSEEPFSDKSGLGKKINDRVPDDFLHRSKRNPQIREVHNDFQFYHGHVPKGEVYAIKDRRLKNSSSLPEDKNPNKPGYVGVNVVPKPQTTALVSLRNGKHGGTMKRFFQRLRSRFHKKKKDCIRPSNKKKARIEKRSTRHARSLNPLKKLKEIFGTRMDRKQEAGSKLFDYEVYMKHVTPYKSSAYRGLIDSVVTAMNTSTLVPSALDVRQSSSAAGRYEDKTIYPPRTKALNENSSVTGYRELLPVKTTDTSTTAQHTLGNAHKASTLKNTTETDDSTAINLKVTTMYDDRKPIEHTSRYTNNMAESLSEEVSKLMDKMKTATTTERLTQDIKPMQTNDFTTTLNISHSKKKIIEKDDSINEIDNKMHKNRNIFSHTKYPTVENGDHVHANDFMHEKSKYSDYVDTKNDIIVKNDHIDKNDIIINKSVNDYPNSENTIIDKDDGNVDASAHMTNKDENSDYADTRDEIIEKDDELNENGIISNKNGNEYSDTNDIVMEKYDNVHANDYIIDKNKNPDYTDANMEIIEKDDNANEDDTMMDKNRNVDNEYINTKNTNQEKNDNREYSNTKNDVVGKNLNLNENNDTKNKTANDIMIHNNRLTGFPGQIIHLLTQIEINNETITLNTARNDSVAGENVQEIKLAPKTINKRAKSTGHTESYNVTNMARDGVRRGYQTLPNFFNDFEMWHNDILHSEKIDTWQKILNNINQPLRYRPPDVTAIERELNTLRKYMYTKLPMTKKSTTIIPANFAERSINKTLINNTELQPIHVVRREDDGNNGLKEFYKRNQDSYDKLIEFDKKLTANLSRIATTQFRKVLHANDEVTNNVHNDDPENKEESRGSTVYLEPASDATLVMGTTLLAYDDSLQFITGKTCRSKDKSTAPSNGIQHSTNIITKLHKVPDQYFSTPLPMRSKDFENFLKENSLDIKSVTTPLDFFSVTDNAVEVNQKKQNAKTINNTEGIYESTNDYRQKYKYYKLFEIKNMVENGTETILPSAPIHTKGRYKNNELINKNYFFDFDNLMDDFNEERMTAYNTADSSGTSGVVIFNKIKDRLKNLGTKKNDWATKLQNGTTTTIDTKKVDCTTNLANDSTILSTSSSTGSSNSSSTCSSTSQSTSSNTSSTTSSNTSSTTNLSTTSSIRTTELNDVIVTEIYFDEFEDTLEDKEIKQKDNAKTQGDHKSKSNNKVYKNPLPFEIKTKTEITIAASPIKQTMTKCHKKQPNETSEIKKNSPYTQFVHNNLLFSYVKNKEKNTDDVKTSSKSDPQSSKDNGPPNDSEADQIRELVRVVEAVVNYTRPSVVVHVDLPTYYRPDNSVSDTTPAPRTDNAKSIWNDFILKYVSGIALIELLSKFGIIKAVEANLTDGKERDANACGVFSGFAEARPGTDLTRGDAVARVGRSLKGATRYGNLNSSLIHKRSENETVPMLRRTTTQPSRRGTIIYDLKQLGRPRETKQRRGHTRFDKISTRKVNPPQPKKKATATKNDIYGNAALSEPQMVNLSSSSTPTTMTTPTTSCPPPTQTSPAATTTSATMTTPPSTMSATSAATATPTTTMPSTTSDKTNSDGFNFNDKELQGNTKDSTKNPKLKPTHRHRVAVIITKIYSETKKINKSKESLPGTEMQPGNTIAAFQFAKKNVSSSSKSPIIYTFAHTTTSGRVSPITKTSEALTSSSEIVSLFNPLDFDITTPYEDGSLYVTNYYDLDPIDTEGQVLKPENGTKAKDLFVMKHSKRDIKSQETYTAKNVAALEIIVDLMRNKRIFDENDTPETENETSTKTTTNSAHTNTRPNDTVSNSIQVYIEIPYNYYNERKRSLHDTVKIRKIFTAKLLTPVDIEYQIHSAEVSDASSSEQETTSAKSTFGLTSTTAAASTKTSAFSGGLYVLVEDNNSSIPNGHYILKPVHSNGKFFDSENVETQTTPMALKPGMDKLSNILPNVTLTKEFIAAVNKHLVELYQNVGTSQHKIKARNVSELSKIRNRNTAKYNRDRRRLNWETVKTYFGHDKVCNCHCKPNHTMCRACAASDAVISEIIFELDNLAQYMNDHCTEIQTYFWMNPSGGRKLRDAVHRIDKTLYDYYKRARGKCKGRPCKHFTFIEKRDFENTKGMNYIGDPMIRDMEKIADDLERAAKYNIGSDELFTTGTKCLDIITKCMHLKPFNKRADDSKKLIKNVYSLDNVNVNIICKQDSIESPPNDLDHSTLLSTLYSPPPTDGPTMFYYDTGGYKTESRKRKKGFKSFLSFRRNGSRGNKMTKNRLFMYTDTSLDGTIALNKIKLRKRQIEGTDEIELPFSKDSSDLYLFDHSNRKSYTPKIENETKKLSEEDEKNIRPNGNTVVVNVSLHVPNKENYTDYNKPTDDGQSSINFDQDGNVLPTTFSDIISLGNTSESDKSKPSSDNFLQENELMNIKKTSNSQKVKGLINLHVKGESTQLEKPSSESEKHIRNVKATRHIFHKPKKENPCKTKKTTQHNFISRMKEATIKFLDDLDGTDNFLIDNRTIPVYVYGKPITEPTKSVCPKVVKTKNYELNKLVSKIYKKGVLIDQIDTSLIKPSKYLRNYEKSAVSVPKNLEVPNVSNKKELLLSILDFETNKLNDEWKQVAAVMSTRDDSGAGDEARAEYRPPPEVPMTDKTLIKKAIRTTTTTSRSSVSKSGNRERKAGGTASTAENSSTRKGCDTCGDYYDIREDLPKVELAVPAFLTSTKVYGGFFEKLARKFAIKILPEQRTDKEMLRGRSVKRKIPSHSRPHAMTTLAAGSKTRPTPVVDISRPTLTRHNASNTSRHTKAKTKAIQIVKTKKRAYASDGGLEGNQITLARMTLTPIKITVKDTAKKWENEEACENNGETLLCDIDATMINIEEVYKRLTKCEFARYVKNITCARYKDPPRIFEIKARQKKGRHRVKPDRVPCGGSRKSKWNWIRGKRSSPSLGKSEQVDIENEYDYVIDEDEDDNLDDENPAENVVSALRSDRGDYEKLYLGGDGIYRVKESERRKKRAVVDMSTIENTLKHLPPLRQLVNIQDEVFVLHGDSISIQCNLTNSLFTGNNMTDLYRYSWSAERRSMLKRWNVNVVGPTVSITQAEPKNYGTYTCYQDSIVSRSIRLNIINIPSFNIVFTPLYRCQGDCSYEDLENIQRLGSEMGRTVSCCGGDAGSFRVDHPLCLSNKENEEYLRPTMVMTPITPMAISCEAECLRDLTCSLALLAAQNVPILSNVTVLIRYDRLNKTLMPDTTGTSITDLDVMKSIKYRDSNGHREYRKLSMTMRPGDVDVVVVCPAGYYLVADQKICVVCPANTCSSAGQNACSACPRGTHSDPGSAACRIGLGRLRRYEWVWSPWHWFVAVCVLVCVGCAVAWLSPCRRARRPRAAASRLPVVSAAPLIVRRRSSSGRRRARRPISPSRVLLERLFKHSPSSSRASDSQETRICVWKEKNVPPPLPPIDFDYW